MGFTAEQATSALQAANGDLDLAVELLLQQSEAEPVPKGENSRKFAEMISREFPESCNLLVLLLYEKAY